MVNMARQEQRAALQRFKDGLEDLTFNSRPLIEDLTRAAEASKSQAAQIVEIIESRILQVDRALEVSGSKIISCSNHYCVYICCQFLSMFSIPLYFVDMFRFHITCDLKGVVYHHALLALLTSSYIVALIFIHILLLLHIMKKKI